MQLTHILLLTATLVIMEIAVTLFHRHVMHGIGWKWHASHHERGAGRGWERNDWFAVVFAGATILLFILGGSHAGVWWIALGITLYGLLYGLLHDVLTHRRFGPNWQPRHAYLRRLVAAHRLHHAVRSREGGVSFGFLYAPPVETVRRQLRSRQVRQ
ncbi:sterol desaturase family protein [Noviherbaspirillum aridicola]|uniref:Fatty acid hydroxylase domain-containing protein n=1 Tax=Noviherbaspirillum aridicola TaxID=2849687 RepID=A0ABQ4Q678_9BURK|nr:sterol desaturase family protein [Noviherbaspirillum aridicola]GIZ52724.1 hypothetical protein NCCP691_27380 [Noviherbaspirillum aridicola]